MRPISEAFGFGTLPTASSPENSEFGASVNNPIQVESQAASGKDVGANTNTPTGMETFEVEDARYSADKMRRKSAGCHRNNLFMTVSLILNTMIGSGILGLPKVFADAGVVCATFMIIVGAVLIWLGMVAVIEAGIYVNRLDYSEVAEKAMGLTGKRLVDWSIVLGNLGAMMSYVIVLGSTTSHLLLSWGCTNDIACGVDVMSSLLMATVVFPVCTNREFGHLAFASVFSVIAVVSVILLVLIGGPIRGEMGSFQVEAYVHGGILTQMGAIFFSLNGTFASFQTFTSMENMTSSGWKQASLCSICIGVLFTFITGLVGYLSFGPDTKGIILENFTGHYADFFRVMMVFHLCLYIPVDFTTMRESALKIYGIPGGKLDNFYLSAYVTFGILTATTFLVLVLYEAGLASGQAFSVVINLTGSISASLIALILPAAIYLTFIPPPTPESALKDRCFYYAVGMLLFFGLLTVGVVPIFTVLAHTSLGKSLHPIR
jgi:proton-coupled amino acid transporter